MPALSLHNGNTTASNWRICARSTPSSQMTTSTTTTLSAPLQTRHLAGKKLFRKLNCSQAAYHCLQRADQRSVKLLAFNFVNRTFAYRRLAQGLSRALSAFSSFKREYLDSVIKADQCAQYVDDFGNAANTTKQLIKNIRAVFKCIRKAGLKLTIENAILE